MGYYRARKTDFNQAEIVRALKAAGCGVVDLSGVGKGCPDLLVHPKKEPVEWIQCDGCDGIGAFSVAEFGHVRCSHCFGSGGSSRNKHVLDRGTVLMEVKNKAGRGDKLTPAQVKFHAEWRGPIIRVTSSAEALAAMGLAGIVEDVAGQHVSAPATRGEAPAGNGLE